MLTKLLIPKIDADKRLARLIQNGQALKQQVISRGVPVNTAETRKVLWKDDYEKSLSEIFEDVAALDRVIQKAAERANKQLRATGGPVELVGSRIGTKSAVEIEKSARDGFAARIDMDIHRLENIRSLLDKCEAPQTVSGDGADGPLRYVAVVCESGHVYSARWQEDVPLPHKFCRICRAKLLSVCPSCAKIIDPAELDPKQDGLEDWDIEGWSPSNYCPYCSEPFPWTRRRLEAVDRFLATAKGLSKPEQDEIRDNWQLLLVQVPETPVAAYKINQTLSKMGSDTAGVVKKILMDVATDWVKKYLSGQIPPV